MKAQSEQRISLRCIDAKDTSNPLNGKIINLIIWKYSENGGNFLASNYTESVIYFAYKNGSAFNGWYSFSDDATFLSYHNPTTASDFNEMRTIGAYWMNPSVTTENHPSNTFGILEVMGGMQRFTEYDNQRRIFVRFYANSQWTSWVSFDHS